MLKSTNVCRKFPNVSRLLETAVYERRRGRKGLSQQKLSEAMEMSRNCIQQIECYEHLPLLSTLIKLTRALDFSDEEYANFMVKLRDAYEADAARQKELAGNAV